MAIPVALVLLAGGAAVAVAAGASSSNGTVATFKLPRKPSMREAMLRAQMTTCERIVKRREPMQRGAGTKFVVDITAGVVDKLDAGLGLLASSSDARKRKMEDDYWKAFGTLFTKFWADFVRGWWNSWKNFWTNALVSLGLIDTSPDERYSQVWIDRAEAAFNKAMSLGIPAFQGFNNLGDPRTYSKDNLPIPKWVAQELEYAIESFLALPEADRAILRDFWLRSLKLRDGAARVLFSGVGSTKDCPEIDCKDKSNPSFCKRFEWENCGESVQPIYDPQSITYVAAQVYATSYGTVVSSAQWYALEEEMKLWWKGSDLDSELDLSRIFLDRKTMGEDFYKDNIRSAALYVTAPYNLPLSVFVKVLRIASAAAKRSPTTRMVKLAPVSMA